MTELDPVDNEIPHFLIDSESYDFTGTGKCVVSSDVNGEFITLQFNFTEISIPGKVKRGRRQRQDEEMCPDNWVMILDGDPPPSKEERDKAKQSVILPPTCNENKQELDNFSLTSRSNKATIYFKKQGKASFKVNRTILVEDKSTTLSDSRCLWDCTWKENPFFRKTGFWRFGGWGDTSERIPFMGMNDDADNCVKVYFSLPQIPTNLTCLDDCFNKVATAIKRGDLGTFRCTDSERMKIAKATSDDENIDCLVEKSKSEPPREQDDIVEGRNHQQLNRLRENQARRASATSSGRRRRRAVEETAMVNTDAFHRLIPAQPLEMALVFCIMANLDKRARLPSLRYPKEEYYRGPLIWGNGTDGQDCADFLPKFWEEESKESNQRLFGPASSTVER